MPAAAPHVDPMDPATPFGRAYPLLKVRPTSRPYPLKEFYRVSPELRPDIRLDHAGTPLRLSIQLRNAQLRAIRGAAIYIWHHDNSGWRVDLCGDELKAVTCMRGLQITDSHGWVSFDTVQPQGAAFNESAALLQIYFNNGHHVTARTEVYVRLPCEAPPAGPQNPAMPHLATAQPKQPGFSAAGTAAVVVLEDITTDTPTGGLHGRLCIDVDV